MRGFVVAVGVLIGCVLQGYSPLYAAEGSVQTAHLMNLGAIVSIWIAGIALGSAMAEYSMRRQ